MSIAMATLFLGLLAAPCLMTAVAVKTRGSNCTDLCGGDYDIPYDRGNNSIPYPFGIGPECSLPGFSLACRPDGADNTLLFLGNSSMEVWDDSSIEVWGFDMSFPAVITSIGYFKKLAPTQNYSVHWEAPGRPFAISGSSSLSLFIVGCGFRVSLTGDSGEVGNCSVTCLGDQIMNRLPKGLCIGIGCCRIDIAVPLRAFTLNISRTGQSTRLLEQVNAFISYNQYYGYFSEKMPYQFQPSDLKSDLVTDTGYPVSLIWAIPYQPNCKRAMEDKTSYACVSSHSECQEAPIAGYTCNCAEGYDGNPYIVNGCVLRDPPPGSLSSRFSPVTRSLLSFP